MKKIYLLLLCIILIISACGKKNEENDQNTKNIEDVLKFEEMLSRFYTTLLMEVNKIENERSIAKVQNKIISTADQMEENMDLQKETGEEDSSNQAQGAEDNNSQSQGGNNQGQSGSQKKQGSEQQQIHEKALEKSYISLKEIYDKWDTIQIKLKQSGVSDENIQQLDEHLSEIGYYIYNVNLNEAMLGINRANFVVADIVDSFGKNKSANIIRLAYYLNNIEVQAHQSDEVKTDIAKINEVLDNIEKDNAENYKDKVFAFRLSVNSIDNATKYQDANLIKMKTSLLRDDIKILRNLVED